MTLHLIHESVPVRRGLVADGAATHVRRMKQSVWLYLYLLLAVNRASGERLIAPAHVARDMGLSEETVRSWLGHLRRAGYVTVRREGDHLCVRISRWRAGTATLAEPNAPSAAKRAVSADPAAESLARALGADPEDPFIAETAQRTDPRLLDEVLQETLRVPAIKIRKSRLALFRYLLNKRQQP